MALTPIEGTKGLFKAADVLELTPWYFLVNTTWLGHLTDEDQRQTVLLLIRILTEHHNKWAQISRPLIREQVVKSEGDLNHVGQALKALEKQNLLRVTKADRTKDESPYVYSFTRKFFHDLLLTPTSQE